MVVVVVWAVEGGREALESISGPARDTGFLHGLLTSMQVPKVPQDPDR